MNITPGYGHQVEVTNKTQNLHESEADKEAFKETEDLMKNDNESFVSHVNMPAKEKEVLSRTLNEMNEKDKSMTLLTVMAPSSMDATWESEFLDYDEIMKRIDNILNPAVGGKPDAQLEKTLTMFQELFNKNFDEYSEQNEQNRSEKNREAQLSRAKLLNEEIL